jgi:hypothetical protein
LRRDLRELEELEKGLKEVGRFEKLMKSDGTSRKWTRTL